MDSLFNDLETKVRDLWPQSAGDWGLNATSGKWHYMCGIDRYGGWKYAGVSDTLPKALWKLIELGEAELEAKS